ncbi:MAG: homocitrate synthase [Planctomycetota bacterium]
MSLADYAIIESTLREGEQFVNAFFSTEQKIRIATMLDAFGVEYIELTSPLASPQSRQDCETIAQLGLKAKTLTHTRCNMVDAKLAVETGVDGVDTVIGTSSQLRKFSHGKSIDEIIAMARDVIGYLREQNVEVRFSTEDSLRSDTEDIFRIYEAVAEMGVDRVGVADTVGVGSPRQIYELVSQLRERVSCDIEFHGHNDSGCAIANAHAALEAGATHIDTSVLGIGERNGIASLGGFIARMYVEDPELARTKYNLRLLDQLDQMVAQMVGINVPFNNYITGYCAFTHKAGIHAKAVLNDPSTYEALRPEDFGLTRYVSIAHRLTGWNAVKNRAEQLGLALDDRTAKALTEKIKALADDGALTLGQVDAMLHKAAAEPETVEAAASS